MSVFHIVAFKVAASATLAALVEGFTELPDLCQKNGSTYIKSIKGGKQISTEDKHGDMQVAFILEFASVEDLQYYIDEDPVHAAFKARAGTEYGVNGVIALDFEDQKWPL